MKVSVVKARNVKFSKMDLTQKRLAVLADVRKYVEGQYIVPSSGVYFSIKDNRYGDTDELCTIIRKGSNSCYVCAIGSIFMGVVGWKDNYTFGKGIYSGDMLDYIGELWSPLEMRLIETVFERSISRSKFVYECYNGESVGSLLSHCRNSWDYNSAESERLLSIITNMESNNGRFLSGWTVEELDEYIKKVGEG